MWINLLLRFNKTIQIKTTSGPVTMGDLWAAASVKASEQVASGGIVGLKAKVKQERQQAVLPVHVAIHADGLLGDGLL